MEAPKMWKLGAWLHENIPQWKHPRVSRRNIIPEAVKDWMCWSFDYLIWVDGVNSEALGE